MINITVTVVGGVRHDYGSLERASVQEAVDAAKLLHPNWTHVQVLLVNTNRAG